MDTNIEKVIYTIAFAIYIAVHRPKCTAVHYISNNRR
nr:MAG TPA: hypothetical protein [Caudoviricetes sp.]